MACANRHFAAPQPGPATIEFRCKITIQKAYDLMTTGGNRRHWQASLKDILLGKQRLATRLTIGGEGLGAASFIAQMRVQHVTVPV